MQSISGRQYPGAISACLAGRPLLAVFVAIAGIVGTASAEAQFVCLPTCADTDGKMFVVPGGGTSASTFTRPEMVLKVDVPAAVAQLEVGIFDGDSGATDLGGAAHWDQGTVPMTFELYTDPEGDGIGNVLIRTDSGAAMLDNDWFTILQGHHGGALSGGVYRYALRIVNSNPNPFTWSAFKVRTPFTNTIRVGPQIFSIIAPLGGPSDAQILYPSYPALTPTTYDGNWEFFFEVQPGQKFVTLWDGDTDFGASDCSTLDTDDLDTPNGVPAFAIGTTAVAEGVATTTLPACPNGLSPTGNPPDDDLSGSGTPYVRTGSVLLRLIDPNGTQYTNLNPAGNKEWEQFTVSSEPGCSPASADFCVGTIVPGMWRMQVLALDAGNVNSFFIPLDTVTPERRVRVQKVTNTGTHPAQIFQGTIAPGGPTTWALNLAQNAGVSARLDLTVGTAAQTVTETSVPHGWTLVGYALKADPNGAATCSPTDSYQPAPAQVPSDMANYLVCIRNDFVDGRRVRIQKITAGPAPQSVGFSGSISPGGPSSSTWAVQVAANATLSDVAVRDLTTSAQTVTENPTTDYALGGFTVKPDPNGTATCAPTENYLGTQATIPGDCDDYLVCVKNTYIPPPRRPVRIIKTTNSAFHPDNPAVFVVSVATPSGVFQHQITLPPHPATSGPATTIQVESSQITLTETAPPPNWSLVGYIVKPDPDPSTNQPAVCSPNDVVGPTATIPAGSGGYLVCVRNAYTFTNRRLTFYKVTRTPSHPAQTFGGTILPVLPAPALPFVVSLPLNATLSAGDPHDVPINTVHIVTEYAQPDWDRQGFNVIPDNNPSSPATCAEPYSGTFAVIPADTSNYIICVCNSYNPTSRPRNIRVQKLTVDPVNPAHYPAGVSFGVTIQPGLSNTPASLSLSVPANASVSGVQTAQVSSQAQTVTESNIPAFWFLVGYAVKLDNNPSSPAVCTGNEAYGSSAIIPQDFNNYLVCIKNQFGRRLRIQKLIRDPANNILNPPDSFTLSVLPGGPVGAAPVLTPLTPSLTVPNTQTASSVSSLAISFDAQSVTETVMNNPPGQGGYGLVGFNLIADPNGTAVCPVPTGDPTLTYTGTSATVPAGTAPYLLCVRNDIGRKVTFQKVTLTPQAGPTLFDLWVSGSGAGPQLTLPATQQLGTPVTMSPVSTALQIVTEVAPPAGWSLDGFLVQPYGVACNQNAVYAGTSATIPAGFGWYTVCVKNTFVQPNPPTRTLRIMKVTGNDTYPFTASNAFGGTVLPGDQFNVAVGFAVGLTAVPAEAINTLTISPAAQSVTETVVPANWTTVGQYVVPDPSGTATCNPNASFLAFPAIVPAGPQQWLVCIRNDYNNRLLHLTKVVAGTPSPNPATFTMVVTPALGAGLTVPVPVPALAASASVNNTVVLSAAQVVSEAPPPAPWVLLGYSAMLDPLGTAVCPTNPALYSPVPPTIPAGPKNWRICVLNQHSRTIRVQKITTATPANNPGGTFGGTITPAALSVIAPWSVVPLTMAANDPDGLEQVTVPVELAQLTLVENPVPAPWTLVGYYVTPDPNPLVPAVCPTDLNQYQAGAAQVPAGPVNYLVCVRNEISRTLRVVKLTGSTTHPQQGFDVQITPTNGPSQTVFPMLTVNALVAPDIPAAIDFTQQIVTETTPPLPWLRFGYVVKPDPDPQNPATCSLTDTYTGVQTLIPAGVTNYLVCVRNEYDPAPVGCCPTRIVRIQKLTPALVHSGQSFTLTVLPGGPGVTSAQLTLGANAQDSGVPLAMSLSTTSQLIQETPVPSWPLAGFVVKPDPLGTATCTINDPYGLTFASIPADTANYLVCVRNDFNPPVRNVRIVKMTTTPQVAPQIFNGTIAPGVPATAFSELLPALSPFSAGTIHQVAAYQQHTVAETAVPQGWALQGYTVQEDLGSNVTLCSVNNGNPPLGLLNQAIVPADNKNYLVCIQNAVP